MSAFDIFQTATGTMRKVVTDEFGDPDPDQAVEFEVELDPVLGRTRTFDQEGEEVEGMETVISPHDSIDLTHENWELEYNGRTYQINQLEPLYDIGTNNLSHIEVTLR